jgi:hypothetical protein
VSIWRGSNEINAGYLKEHAVTEARDRGWDTLSNGDFCWSGRLAATSSVVGQLPFVL